MCVKIKCLVFLIALLLLANILHKTISHSYNKNVCNWDDYYEPYITIQETRNDLPILEIRNAGTYDMREQSGIICINGPGFMHTQITSGTSGTLFPVADPLDMKIFEHECFTFNIRQKDAYKSRLAAIDENTLISGLKLYWVTLFGESEDYRKPSKEMYYDSQFGYLNPPNTRVTGGSFAFMVAPTGKLQSGPTPDDSPCKTTPPDPGCPFTAPFRTVDPNPKAYCLSIGGDVRVNITFVPRPTAAANDNTGYICTVKDPYADPAIAQLFDNENLTKSDYEWYDCPDGDYGGLVNTTLNVSQLIDFRIIDPALMTHLGSPGKKAKPGYPGYVIEAKAAYNPPTYGNFPYPGYYFPTDKNYPHSSKNPLRNGTQDFLNIQYDATECSTDLPKPADDCNGGNDKACDYLKHVMGSDKILWRPPLNADGTIDDGTGTASTAPPDDGVPFGDRLLGAWRIEIMDVIQDIFSEACPQVSPMLAPAVGRIVEYYLLQSLKKAGTPGPPPDSNLDKWKDSDRKEKWTTTNKLLDDLRGCKNSITNATRLDFRRARDLDALSEIQKIETALTDTTLTPKEFSEIQSRLGEKRFRFPFEVKVMRERAAHNIFYHKEAAEIEYDFNLAIDLHWKIFNTALGYCNSYLKARVSAVDTNMYSFYKDDLFSFIDDKWINADDTDTDNEVFRQLFGAFISGGPSIYLESCMEGAFIATHTQGIRPPRPVLLRDTKSNILNPKSLIQEENFFIKMPDPAEDTLYNSKLTP